MSLAAFYKNRSARRFSTALFAFAALSISTSTLGAQDKGWVRQFGTANDDQARAVVADDSGVYVTGWTIGELPDQEKRGREDSFVRKYDSDGTEIWTRQFGIGTYSTGLRIAKGKSGVYVAGSVSHHNIFIRKLDVDGNSFWTDSFGTVGEANEEVGGVAVDDTGVYLAGSTADALPDQTSAGNADAFVRKYDAEGKQLWTRQFGTSDFEQVRGIAASPSGVFVAGMTTGVLPGQVAEGLHDAFLRKYDLEGNELWTRQFGSSNLDDGCGVAVDDSGVYVVGSTMGDLPGQTSAGSSDVFVRKYDLDGKEVWTRQFGTSEHDQARAIAVHSSGVYVSAWTLGSLPGQSNQGFHDGFVVQYDLEGKQLWSGQFGSSNLDDPFGISVSESGLYVAGLTGGKFPGQEYAGNADAFVAKLAPSASASTPALAEE